MTTERLPDDASEVSHSLWSRDALPTIPDNHVEEGNISEDNDDGDAVSRLQALTTGIRDQADVEAEVARKAADILSTKNDELDQKRIDKVRVQKG